MKCAVISDVHANIEALKTVLKDIKKKRLTNILFLGDAVGYGPDPNECINVLNSECRVLLAGNHDWAVLGLTSTEYFNPHSKTAIEWTKENIDKETLSILKGLPISRQIESSKILLVHSTPKEPEQWHYLLTLWDAEINFHYFDNKICLLGHSHQPFIIEKPLSGEIVTHRTETKIKEDSRYIINVGSVGQPRDLDPRACYAVIDEESVKLHRVEYDIEKTQNKMKMHGLPLPLIERLSKGV
ncbi:MAG: metallophosphoesterase family protein [Thermodesulfovibrionales bacterium]|nr:metallophosphoesterase family protein [Thermodesulfovibrionales bacterium]